MEIKPSIRLGSLGGYAFAEVDKLVAELKKQGISPIDFGVGDPSDPTPEVVREAIKNAVEERKSSGYPSYIGSAEFREAIAEWTKRRFDVELDPNKEVTSSIGAKEAVFNFHEGTINPGDYVIAPNPGYPPYTRGTLFAEGKMYYTNLLEENDFFPNIEEIPIQVARKAKVMWVNYPNNPTTQVATKEFYRKLIDFGHDNNIIIASDEPYTENYYDEKPISILEVDREGVVVFQSLSKRSNMTGYRAGWLAGDENVINIFKKIKTNIDSGTPTFIQDAAIAALGDEKHVEEMREKYRQRRDVLVNAFKDVGLKDCTPKATIYIWQKVPEGMDSVEFTKRLLSKETAVVATPGQWISEEVNGINPGKNYVRFALVPSLEQCEEAAERIKKLSF